PVPFPGGPLLTCGRSVEDAVQDASDHEAAHDAAHDVTAAATAAAPAITAPALLLRPGRVDVALSELQRLGGELPDAAGSGEGLLPGLLRGDQLGDVDAQPLGFREAGAGIGPDPAAVPGDEPARHAELSVGVVESVLDLCDA